MRVLDFTRILSGPYCSLLLSDLGADVIKVERADRGDDTRLWGPPFLDSERRISTYFASLNRGKRSVAVEFRTDEGRQLIRDLARRVDVVIENFRPGVAEDLCLDHAHLEASNPGIVSCSISGYGRSGAYRDFPGTEIVVEAMSGLMDVTGDAEGDPVRFGIAMIDIATGLTAATRVLAALLRARETGQGSHVDCSLYSTALAALGTLITSYSATGLEPRRWGSHHPTISPYGGFPTADGHLVTGVINDVMWPAFCKALDLPRVAANPEFATNALRVENRQELERAIAEQTCRQPVAYWLERLRGAGLLAAPIRTVAEAVSDPATREMGLFVELANYPGAFSPRLDGVPADGKPQPVAHLGEHTAEVLAELLELPTVKSAASGRERA